jgi:glycosyltransferase involved in cell wall biosynthesis
VSVIYPDPRLTSLPRLGRTLVVLRRVLARLGPALVLANAPRCQLYSALALVGVRDRPQLVHVLHEQESANRRVLRMLYRRSGRLEAVGANGARTYRDRLPGVAVHEVNNFLSRDEFRRFASVPRPTDAPGQTRVLGVLTRMIPEKGLVELIEELSQAGRDVWGELRIAALPQQPAYERMLKGRIAELELVDRVSLVGPVTDTPAFLEGIDMLIVPSTGTEGQPTVVLEALAAGRTVIMRSSLYCEDYSGLPVIPYETPADLRAALQSSLRPAPSDDLLQRRFGPGQALSLVTIASSTVS